MTNESTEGEVQERSFSAEERKRLAEEGKALPDGSFPIETRSDLANAVRLYGLGESPATAKSHIVKCAKGLGAEDALPEDWMTEAPPGIGDAADDQAIKETKECPQCGKRIPEDASKCPECKADLSAEKVMKTAKAMKKEDKQTEADESEDERVDASEGDFLEPLVTGAIRETIGDGKQGKRWSIDVIRSGVSANNRLWTKSLLTSRSFLEMLEGVDVYEDHPGPSDEREYPIRRVGNHIGLLKNVGTRQENDGTVVVEAEMVVLSPTWQTQLLNAHEVRELGRYQFSINARGAEQHTHHEGRSVREVARVNRVPSVDLVPRGGAGGRVRDLLEIDPCVETGECDTGCTCGKHTTEHQEETAPENVKGADIMEETTMGEEELKALIDQKVAEALREAKELPAALKANQFKAKGDKDEEDDEEDDEDMKDMKTKKDEVQEADDSFDYWTDDDDDWYSDATPEVPDVAVPEAITEAAEEAVNLLGRLRAVTQAAETETRIAHNVTLIESGLAGVELPKVMIDNARARLMEASKRRALEDTDVQSVIHEYQKMAAAFERETPISESSPQYSYGASSTDNYLLRLESMLTPNRHTNPVLDADGREVEGFWSLREAYAAWPANRGTNPTAGGLPLKIMRELSRCTYDSGIDSGAMRESLSTTSWADVMADVMHQVLIRGYRDDPRYNEWTKLVSDIENVGDFRNRHFMRVGGYGDLSVVAEGAAYPALSSPDDEEVEYGVSKRGGIEQSITLEMVANDQVQALARIPQALQRAAKRTLYKFVFAMVTTDNAAMDYDSTTLYHSNHANTGTTALSVAGLSTTQQAMRDQTAYGESNEILGPRNQIKFIIVPNELTDRANRIVNPSAQYAYGLDNAAGAGTNPDTDTSLDPRAFAGRGIEVLTYDALTNAKDWWSIADPGEVPTVVIGFFGGRREPELFFQNDPNQGITYNTDSTSIKIRHIYGGDVIDHRSFYQQDVT